MRYSLVALINLVAITGMVFNLLIFLAPPALAQNQAIPLGLDAGLKEGETAAKGANLPATGDAITIILKVINFILKLIAILAVLFLVIAGVMYITSLGDENRAGRAKRMILYVVIGLVIIVLSQLIVNLVLSLATGTGTPGSATGGGNDDPSGDNTL